MNHPALAMFSNDPVDLNFQLTRGRAIQSYTTVELSLAMLFSCLMGVPQDYAGVSFFKINNARARLSILERLLKKRHGAAYNIFWNALEKELNTLDSTRNKVVHWAEVANLEGQPDGAVSKTVKLAPPNFWDRTENTPELAMNDLLDFILKCDFFSRLLNMFFITLSGQLEKMAKDEKYKTTWRGIFQRPITYPPPDSHPLYRKPPAP